MSRAARETAERYSWAVEGERCMDIVDACLSRRRQAFHLATVSWWPRGSGGVLSGLLREALRVTDVISSGWDGLRGLLIRKCQR